MSAQPERTDTVPASGPGMTIAAFIRGEILFDRAGPLSADTPLGGGLIDSLGVEQLIEFLEERFDITFRAVDLVPSNFRTVRAIERLVVAKRTSEDLENDDAGRP
jgi:acyl carrier protein